MYGGFKDKVRRELRESVGGYCSAPYCGIQTSVYNRQTGKHKTTGDAAHICGAKGDAARFHELPAWMDRHSFENGIWLCAVCHRMIDNNNEGLFSSEVLWRWKSSAEEAHQAAGRCRPGAVAIGADIGAEHRKATQFLQDILPLEDLVWKQVRTVRPDDQRDCHRTLDPQIRQLICGRAGIFFSKKWNAHHPQWTFTSCFQDWQSEIVRQAEELTKMPGLRIRNDGPLDLFHFRDENKNIHFRNATAQALQTYLEMLSRFELFLEDYKGPLLK